jgi:hypothetical protein
MIRALALATTLIATTITNPASADCDLSKPANIPAAYKQATGNDLPADHDCVRASSTFPGLVWVGHFANDRGCIGEGILVGCKLDPPGYAAPAMTRAGWAKADLATRQKLALAWLREIDDLDPVSTKPDKFPKPFNPPAATTSGKATVVDLWIVDPAGMQPVASYHHLRYTFAADGTHGSPASVEDVDVPMN